MAGLVPAIHDLNTTEKEFVDARAKPGHDDENVIRRPSNRQTALPEQPLEEAVAGRRADHVAGILRAARPLGGALRRALLDP
jgi:hypothetical protein